MESTSSKPQKIVLLDLDGTLSKSGPGIMASVAYAYRQNGLTVPSDAVLNSFIGPSLPYSLKAQGVAEELIPAMVKGYCEAYTEPVLKNIIDPSDPNLIAGEFITTAYDGIVDALKRMKAAGYTLVVATAKPTYQAKPVCDHLNLTQYFVAVVGPDSDHRLVDKSSVIANALSKAAYNPEHGDRAVMVGDRWTDANGAAKNGLETIGAGWGYSEPSELEEHGVKVVVNQPIDLPAAVDAYFSQN